MDDERGFWDLLYLPLAVVGPIVVTVAYVFATLVQGEAHERAGQGAGAAMRDKLEFGLYGAALFALVIWGTLKCRNAFAKFMFAVVSFLASLTLMFFAFFSRMAP